MAGGGGACVLFPIQGKGNGGRLAEEMKVEMGGRHLTGAPGGTAFPPPFLFLQNLSSKSTLLQPLKRTPGPSVTARRWGKCKCRPHPVVSRQLFWKIKTQAVYRFRKLECFMGTATKRKHSSVSGRPLLAVFTWATEGFEETERSPNI